MLAVGHEILQRGGYRVEYIGGDAAKGRRGGEDGRGKTRDEETAKTPPEDFSLQSGTHRFPRDE